MTNQAALSVYRGETFFVEVSYTNQDGSPAAGLTDATAELRFSPGAATAPVAGTVNDTTGQINFTIPATTTADWPTKAGGFTYQLWLTDTATTPDTVTMILSGTIQVLEGL